MKLPSFSVLDLAKPGTRGVWLALGALFGTIAASAGWVVGLTASPTATVVPRLAIAAALLIAVPMVAGAVFFAVTQFRSLRATADLMGQLGTLMDKANKGLEEAGESLRDDDASDDDPSGPHPRPILPLN